MAREIRERYVEIFPGTEQLAGGGTTHKGCSPVPEAAVNGHAFHTYSMASGDGNVEFQIRHNVAGRSTYAEGTVDACVFLGSRASSRVPVAFASSAIARASDHIIAPIVGRQPSPETEPSIASQPSFIR